MANTVIALKKSGTSSAVPANLANGELAINYADGKLFYKHANGTIAAILSAGDSFSSVSANGTLLVADSPTDILTITPGNNISIVGDAVNDKVTIGLKDDIVITGSLFMNNRPGAGGSSEGGEMLFANSTSATQSLSGPIVIDIYENRLRFFERDGTNRGVYIEFPAAGAVVGTNLLATAGSSSDSTARDWAASAFAKANAALPNTSGVTFNGSLTISSNLSADRVFSTNNGNGENFKIGDDAWIGDTNLADTLRIKGQQNSSRAYILFGDNDGISLGRQGSNNLTYGGNTVWHAGNDGAGSTLDADLLDGQHGAYYATYADSNAAFAKANAALANTSGITFNGVLNISNNVSTQGLNVTSNVISFGSAMSILPNGMIMIFGDINMLT